MLYVDRDVRHRREEERRDLAVSGLAENTTVWCGGGDDQGGQVIQRDRDDIAARGMR